MTTVLVLTGAGSPSTQLSHGQVENVEVRKPKYRNGSAETEVWKQKYRNRSAETEVQKRKCGNRSMETEVQKPKYRSEKKSHHLISSALLTHVKAL